MSLITLANGPADTTGLVSIIDYEAQIGAISGLTMWWTPRASMVTLDGSGRVVSVAPRGGTTATAIASSETLRPSLATRAIGAHAAMGFDKSGLGEFLDVSVDMPTAAYTAVLVLNMAAGQVSNPTPFGGRTGTGTATRVYIDVSAGEAQHQIENDTLSGDPAVDVAATGIVAETWQVITATFDGATGTVGIRVNAGAFSTETDPDLTATKSVPIIIGGSRNNSGTIVTPWDGMIADVMVVGRDLRGTSDLAVIEQYIQDVYGINLGR